jgi:magnesium transporter
MAAVPTMVAGVYGMNFHNIPELEASVYRNGHEIYYGYFIVLGLLAVVSVGLYRAFRKSGWL